MISSLPSAGHARHPAGIGQHALQHSVTVCDVTG